MVYVSVIMPVYNVEKYLRECMESVINQTLEDIEIICINDGSTDNSLSILEEYRKKDNRITVISQENRGLSAARNVGMKNAKGKYIYFIDSDDYLELNALEELSRVSDENDADMTIFKLRKFDDETKEILLSKYYDMVDIEAANKNRVITYRDIKKHLYTMVASAPAKLFRRDFIRDMEFPEGLIFEDNVFFIETMLKAERVFIYDEYFYNRRIRSDSITTSYFDKFTDSIEIGNLLVDVTKKAGHYEEMKEYLYPRKINNTIHMIKQIDDDNLKEEFFMKVNEDFRAHFDEYDSDETFQKINPRTRHIFYSGVNCKTANEFIYSIQLFDLERKHKKIGKENKKLKAELKKIKEENDEFKSSKAYKMWKRFR